jgi:hypothetical protein
MGLFSNFLKKKEEFMSKPRTLESIVLDINSAFGKDGIRAFIHDGVIGISKTFKNEKPPRTDTIMLEYFPNSVNPKMSLYDLHDSIGRRYREFQYPNLLQDIKNHFNQEELDF